MRRRIQNITAIMVLFALVFTSMGSVSVMAGTEEKKGIEDYVDVGKGKQKKYLTYAVENNLMANSTNKLRPNKKITRGDVIYAVTNLLGSTVSENTEIRLVDIKKNNINYDAFISAIENGLLKVSKKNKVYPTKTANNAYLATVLSRALGCTSEEILGDLKANEVMTRGEFAKFLKENFPNIVTKDTKKIVKGNVVINTPNVTLKGVTVTGDLIIGDGVGDKEVTLRDVKVLGKMHVRGGGENSIIIEGDSELVEVTIDCLNRVSVKVFGGSKVNVIVVNDDSNEVKIVGTVENLSMGRNVNVTLEGAAITGSVNIEGKGASLEIKGESKVEKVVVAEKAKKAEINIDKEAKVEALEVNAERTKVGGDGTVEKAVINNDNVTITNEVKTLEVKEGVKEPVRTETPVATATPTATPNPTTVPSSTPQYTPDPEPWTPPSNPDPTPKVYTGVSTNIDERFETGYPKVQIIEGPNSYTYKLRITYKLKNNIASEAAPVEIFNVWEQYNVVSEHFEKTSSDAVIKGLLLAYQGIYINEDNLYYASPYDLDYVKITDSNEHVLEQSIYVYCDTVNVFSVVKSAEETSAVPVLTSVDTSDLVDPDEGDTSSPYLSGHFINNAMDKIYIPVSQDTSKTVLPSVTAFSLYNNNECNGDPIGSITGIRVFDYSYKTSEYSATSSRYLELSIQGIETSHVNDLWLKYDGVHAAQPLVDESGNKAYYTGINKVRTATMEFVDLFVSTDGQYVGGRIKNYLLSHHYQLEYVGNNGSKLDLYRTSISMENGDAEINCRIENNNPNLREPGATVVIRTVSEGAVTRALDPISPSSIIATSSSITILATPGITTAQYNNTEKNLMLSFNQIISSQAMGDNIILNVDGTDYHVRGISYNYYEYDENGDYHIQENNIVFSARSLKHIPIKSNSVITMKLIQDNESTDYISLRSITGEPFGNIETPMAVTVQ